MKQTPGFQFPVSNTLFLSLTALGISATVTQIVVMREFLTVFYGNELVIAVILANWLFLTGIGSLLGKKSESIRSPLPFLSWMQIAVAILPLVSVVGIRFSKTALFPPGEQVGLAGVFLTSAVLLAPYCIISGFIHPFACVVFSEVSAENRISEVYFLDVFGDILGGLLFSFVLVYLFNSLTITYLLLILNMGAAAVLIFKADYPKRARKQVMAVTLILLCAFSLILWGGDLNRRTVESMFPQQEVLDFTETPYGFLTATRTEGQVNFYENGVPVYSSRVAVEAEESVHYVMLQHPAPERVLLISGGTGALFHEIEKYSVRSMDYVEPDPTVVEFNRAYGGLEKHPHVRIINRDARLFIKSTDRRYDVIIINVPSPDTAALNRYFTREFYAEIQRVLNKKGIIGFGSAPMANYFSPETVSLLSSQYHTLAKVFPHVSVIPGTRVFFVAGNRPLSSDIIPLLEKRGIQGSFMTPDVIKGFITPDRIALVNDAITEQAVENRDFVPTAYYHRLLLWVRIFHEKGLWLLVGLGIMAVLYVSRLEPVTFVVFTTGFTGSCLTVVLLLTFQVMHGYVYFMMGLLVTAFMTGLAAGSIAGRFVRNRDRSVLFRLELAMLLYALALPAIMAGMKSIASPGLQYAAVTGGIPLLLAGAGILAGMEFSVVGGQFRENIAKAAGRLYSADYFGAALGAAVTGVVLVPLLGLYRVPLVAALLHGISILVLYKGSGRLRFWPAAAMFLYISLTGYLLVNKGTGETLYVLSYHPGYTWLIVVSMLILSTLIIFRGKKGGELLARRDVKTLSVLLYVPMIFLPVFKCFFLVPYLFCHVCPGKCIFGYLRPFMVPLACLQNIRAKTWCYQFCPVGILQENQCHKSRAVSPIIKNLARFTVLALFALSYFWIQWARRHPEAGPGSDLFLILFTNRYAFSVTILMVTAGIFLISFYIKRFFCDFFCPVGSFSDLVLTLDRGLAGRWKWWREREKMCDRI